MACACRRPISTLSNVTYSEPGFSISRSYATTGMPWSSALCTAGQDRLTVLGQDDDRVRALRDQVLDVGQLLLGGRPGVGGDVLRAAGLQGLLDRGLVELGPPFLVEVVPGNPDGDVPRRRLHVAPRRSATAVVVVRTRGKQQNRQGEDRQQPPLQHSPPSGRNVPVTHRPSRSTNRMALRASRVRQTTVLWRDRATGSARAWAARQHGTFEETAQSVRRGRERGLLRPFEAPDSLPARATSRFGRTIRDAFAPIFARQGRMQSVGPATDTGADSGGGRQREPRSNAGRPHQGRWTALWLVLGGIGGALVALAVVLALGLALTSSGETVAEAPRFVEEATAAGIDHVYDGEFPYFVGGGVATFDCDDDRRPDLYLAGGADPAALYRNESPVGGALAVREGVRPSDRPHERHRRLPDRRRRRRPDRPRGPSQRRERPAARPRRLPVRARERDLGLRRRRRVDRRVQRDVGGLGHAADPRVRELPRPGEADQRTDVRRQRAGAAAPGGAAYAAPIPLTPGWCTLSVLFSDWDRSGHRDLRMANDRHYYLDGEEQLWRIEPGQPPRLYTDADGWQRL